MRSICLTFAAVSLALSALATGPPRQTDSSFVSYQPGDLPLILSVPHGGARRPASIPDRAQAVVVNDWGSHELALAVAAEIAALWRRGYLDPCALTPLRYCPDEPLTRADLATIVLRLRDGPGVIPPAPAGVFGPAAADWNLWWIEGASRRDLLPPCPSGLPFGCAARPVSRAEAAWSLARAMGTER